VDEPARVGHAAIRELALARTGIAALLDVLISSMRVADETGVSA